MKGAKSAAGHFFLVPTNFELYRMTSNQHGQVKFYFKMAASKASLETPFFRIAGTSEAETSVSGKTQCLLVIGGDKKVSFLE